MHDDFIISLLSGTLRTSTPIMLAALGQVFVQKSGILDLSVEGTMIVSCLAAFIGTFATHSLVFGLACAVLAGAAFSALMAFLCVTVRANQVIAGTALTMLGTGLAAFVYRQAFGIRSLPPIIDSFSAIDFGPLSALPLVGPVIFSHNLTVYLGLALVPVTAFVMNRTSFGLQVRAVGEQPRAADSKGIGVSRIRYACVILGGIYAGLAGASMSLGFMNTYTDRMIAGRGFIAVAVVVFAKWTPLRVLWASLLFGGASTLQMRMQSMGIGMPKQFLQALPYILTVVVLLGVSKNVKFPSALGTPFSRKEK